MVPIEPAVGVFGEWISEDRLGEISVAVVPARIDPQGPAPRPEGARPEREVERGRVLQRQGAVEDRGPLLGHVPPPASPEMVMGRVQVAVGHGHALHAEPVESAAAHLSSPQTPRRLLQISLMNNAGGSFPIVFRAFRQEQPLPLLQIDAPDRESGVAVQKNGHLIRAKAHAAGHEDHVLPRQDHVGGGTKLKVIAGEGSAGEAYGAVFREKRNGGEEKRPRGQQPQKSRKGAGRAQNRNASQGINRAAPTTPRC